MTSRFEPLGSVGPTESRSCVSGVLYQLKILTCFPSFNLTAIEPCRVALEMFPTAKRTFLLLLRTPMIPPPPPPPAFELIPLIHAAGPSRPRATSRTISNLSIYGYPIQSPVHIQPNRGYASDHGKKELYSDEAGSTGAGVSPLSPHLSTLTWNRVS